MTQYSVERAQSILDDIENSRDISKGKFSYGESFFWYYGLFSFISWKFYLIM